MKKRRLYHILLATTLFINTFSPFIVSAKNLSDVVISESNVNKDIVEARKDDLNFLITTLENKHPNMYNKNDKAVFEKKIKEVESNLDKMNDFEFGINLCEILSLIGDSHTKPAIGNLLGEDAHFLPLNFAIVDEGLLISAAPNENKQVLGGILTSINGYSMEEIKQKLMPFLIFDNQVYLDKEFVNSFYIYEILEYYNILNSPENISLGIKIGDKEENINLNAVDSETMKSIGLVKLERPIPETEKDRSKIYFFKPLDSSTLYIQYNSCREDENLPMETFAKQVEDALNEKGYDRVILDLRYNGGGSDGVLIPLMNTLEEKYRKGEIQLYTLIGSNTFSSALINSVMLKDIGSIMVGTPTGGSVDHFGEVDVFELPNSKIKVQYSNKFFDLSTLLKSAKPYDVEPFKPDILLDQTREDYLAGKDTAVEYILNDTKNKPIIKPNITRAELAVELGRDYAKRTGKTFNSLQHTFEDVGRVSYFMPYVVWANDNKIMVGQDEKTFLPDKELTKGELAVVLMRYADLIQLHLNNITKNQKEILDINTIKPWQQKAVNTFGGTNIFPLVNGKFNPDEIVSLKIFENIFKEFKELK